MDGLTFLVGLCVTRSWCRSTYAPILHWKRYWTTHTKIQKVRHWTTTHLFFKMFWAKQHVHVFFCDLWGWFKILASSWPGHPVRYNQSSCVSCWLLGIAVKAFQGYGTNGRYHWPPTIQEALLAHQHRQAIGRSLERPSNSSSCRGDVMLVDDGAMNFALLRSQWEVHPAGRPDVSKQPSSPGSWYVLDDEC